MKLRINLSIMQPSGYIHSQGFIDQARYARFQFRRHGVEVTISKNRLREDSVNIIFGAHLGFNPELKNRYTCVFFNLEQLGEGGATVSEEYIKLLKNSAVIDYDERNLDSYGGTTNNVPIVSFQYAPYLAERCGTPILERPIDLLFFGSINEKRKTMFQRIEACGYSVSVFDHPLYYEERDYFIRQAKAILNCHFYETSRFEQARAFHCLSLGTPVISERTERTAPHPAFENAITWVNDNQIESFFKNEFKKSEWAEQAKKQLEHFSTTDPSAEWSNAFKLSQEQFKNDGKSQINCTPKIINNNKSTNNNKWITEQIINKSYINNEPRKALEPSVFERISARINDIENNEKQKQVEIHINPENYTNINQIFHKILQTIRPNEKINILINNIEASQINKIIESFYSDNGISSYSDCTKFKFNLVNIELIKKNDNKFSKINKIISIQIEKTETTMKERALARTAKEDFGSIKTDEEIFY